MENYKHGKKKIAKENASNRKFGHKTRKYINKLPKIKKNRIKVQNKKRIKGIEQNKEYNERIQE